MHSDKSERLYDMRTVERNIKKGLVEDKDFQKHLASLKDSTSECEIIVLDEDDEKETMPTVEDYKE